MRAQPSIGKKLNKGDRVKKSPMWKFDVAIGTVVKKTSDGYIVIVWDGVNGEWHYTPEQTMSIEVVKEL